MEIAVFLSRAFAAMDAAGHGSGFFDAGGHVVQWPRHGRFAWICPCTGEGEAIQHEFTAFSRLKI
jgi:hypothetical protein